MKWNANSDKALCSRCVRDSKLHEHIESGGLKRRCSLCGSTVHRTLRFGELGPAFRDVVDQLFVQEEGLHGDSAGYLLQDLFEVFQDHVDPDRMIEAVEDILYSGVFVSKDLIEMPDYGGRFAIADRDWEGELAATVLKWDGNKNDAGGSSEWFGALSAALDDMSEVCQTGMPVYRARLHDNRSQVRRFEPREMGAPPAELAPAGRANRNGSPVLYAASDEATAIHEVRPWIGCAVAVAKLTLVRDVLIVDASPRAIVTSPFFQESLDWRVSLADLIHAFARELSRPVGPAESARYEPTQRMCEIVAACGFRGVRYPSALGEGSNIVFFEPASAVADTVQYVRAVRMELEYEELEDEQVYPDSPFEALFHAPEYPAQESDAAEEPSRPAPPPLTLGDFQEQAKYRL